MADSAPEGTGARTVTAANIQTLSEAQRTLLDYVATGGDGAPATARTVKRLVDLGYLIPHEVLRHFSDGLPPMKIMEYEMPLAVHIAWAEACSLEVDEEEMESTGLD